MKRLLENLKNYGADIEGAMRRFLDDSDLYEDCFTAFLSDQSFWELGKALEEKNYESAFEAAHTLKGVTGNMGLTPLYQLICKIVEDLRKKDYSHLQAGYSQILLQLDQLKMFQEF